MRPFSLTARQKALSDLVVVRLPGTGAGSRVAVLKDSFAETVALSQGYQTVAVRSVALAPGLLLSGEADCWLEGEAEVTMVEMITGLTFDRDEAQPSDEEKLRQAWRAARTGSQLKALYRAAGMASILSEP